MDSTAVERAAGNLDRFTRLHFILYDMHLVRTDCGAKVFDDLVRNGWPLAAEVDDATDSAHLAQFAEAGGEVEAREQVAREQGFGEPDRAATGRALEANPWQIDLDARLALQMCRGDVLVFGL